VENRIVIHEALHHTRRFAHSEAFLVEYYHHFMGRFGPVGYTRLADNRKPNPPLSHNFHVHFYVVKCKFGEVWREDPLLLKRWLVF
jgi:hypothetical protein